MLNSELYVQECDLPAGRQAQQKLNSNTDVGTKKNPPVSKDSVSSENRMVLIIRHRCFQLFFQDDLQGDVRLDEAYVHRDDFSLRLPAVF